MRDLWSSAITEEALAGLLLQQGDENDRPRAVQLLVHAYRTYQSHSARTIQGRALLHSASGKTHDDQARDDKTRSRGTAQRWDGLSVRAASVVRAGIARWWLLRGRGSLARLQRRDVRAVLVCIGSA